MNSRQTTDLIGYSNHMDGHSPASKVNTLSKDPIWEGGKREKNQHNTDSCQAATRRWAGACTVQYPYSRESVLRALSACARSSGPSAAETESCHDLGETRKASATPSWHNDNISRRGTVCSTVALSFIFKRKERLCRCSKGLPKLGLRQRNRKKSSPTYITHLPALYKSSRFIIASPRWRERR